MNRRTPLPGAVRGSRSRRGSRFGSGTARAVGRGGRAGGPPGSAASPAVMSARRGRARAPGARGAAPGSGGPLAGLPVRCVLAAPAAVLAPREPVGRVPLRLRAHVVTPLAVVAGERDLVSYSGCHFVVSLRGVRTPRHGPTLRG